ncbi:unnamed protein product, partial [Rotaria socialis]
DECEEAFLNLKKLLLNPKLLAYPNYDSSEPLELHVDASLTGAGAVLSQCQLGVNRPIAFVSTSFGPTEASYSSIARELAGLRWAVKKLKKFLRGRKFILHTDHQPLVYLNNAKDVSNRLARTLEDLADFDFTVRWIPGNTNVIADALSRVNESDANSGESVSSDMQVDPIGSQLTEVKMEGGGDSLVKCFSLWLHGNENEHLQIRECIVKELFDNQKKYGLELNKSEKFKLRILKQTGMLLIPEAVAAFANLYKCEVVLFENKRNPLYFGEKGNRKCFLNGCHNIHYNYLYKKNDISVTPCIKGGKGAAVTAVALKNVATEIKNLPIINKSHNVVVPLCMKPYVDNNNVVHDKIVPLFLRKNQPSINVNTVPLFLRQSQPDVNVNTIPLFLRKPGKPEQVIPSVNINRNQSPLILANVAFNAGVTHDKNVIKIIYGRWSHKQAQLIQKENDQIRALRKVIAAFAPGLQRAKACKEDPKL